MKNKVYHLTIKHFSAPPCPLTLTLTPSSVRGHCFKCSLDKPIWLISEKSIWIGSTPTWEERKFCWSCTLANLTELEQSDYQFENKKELIKEIRASLLIDPSPNEEDRELPEYHD